MNDTLIILATISVATGIITAQHIETTFDILLTVALYVLAIINMAFWMKDRKR